MKLLLSSLIIVTASLVSFAERIDGPANIRQTPKGEVIFSLNESSIDDPASA